VRSRACEEAEDENYPRQEEAGGVGGVGVSGAGLD
jgi:hypothetical protein